MKSRCLRQDSQGSALLPASQTTATPLLATVVATVGSGALNYVYGLTLAFLLSSTEYSLFGGAQSILLIGGVVANSAVPWALAQALARLEPEDQLNRAALTRAAFRLNLMAGGVAALVALPVAAWIGTDSLAIAVSIATFGFFVASTPMGYAQGIGRYGFLSILILGEVAVKLVLGICAVILGGGATSAVVAAAGGAAAIAIFGLILMRHDLSPCAPEQSVRTLARSSNGMVAVQGLVAALSGLLVIIGLVRYGPGPIAARLQIAVTLGQVPVYLALAVSLAAFSGLARADSAPELRIAGLRKYLALGLPVSILLGSVPTSILDRCLPAQFVGSGVLLPWTITAGLAVGIVTMQTTWLKAVRAFRWTIFTLSATLVVASGLGVLGAATFGTRGMAAGTCLGCVLAVVGLSVAGASFSMQAVVADSWRSVAAPFVLSALLVCTRGDATLWIIIAIVFSSLCGRMLLRSKAIWRNSVAAV